MTPILHSNLLPDEIIEEMITVIKNSLRPLSPVEVQKGISCRVDLEKLFKELEAQVRKGRICQWPAAKGEKKFWEKDPDLSARHNIIEFLGEKPLTRSELLNCFKKHLFGFFDTETKDPMQKNLHILIEAKEVIEHPPVGRGRISRFGVTPPELLPYFGKLKKEYEAICKKLDRAAISSETVYKSVCAFLSSVGEKTDPVEPLSEGGRVTPALLKRIFEKVHRIEPAAGQQALVSIPLLRKAMQLPKSMFDEAILTLARQEKIWLHRHVDPAQIGESERSRLISDRRGNYYMGLVLRN